MASLACSMSARYRAVAWRVASIRAALLRSSSVTLRSAAPCCLSRTNSVTSSTSWMM